MGTEADEDEYGTELEIAEEAGGRDWLRIVGCSRPPPEPKGSAKGSFLSPVTAAGAVIVTAGAVAEEGGGARGGTGGTGNAEGAEKNATSGKDEKWGCVGALDVEGAAADWSKGSKDTKSVKSAEDDFGGEGVEL